MFFRTSKTVSVSKHKHSGAPSILGPDLAITGDLAAEGEMHIDGNVQGNIRADKLTVGEHAHVVGDICVREIIVQGEVRGAISASNVQIAKTAKVRGDIVWHSTLGVETGAYFDGQCKHAEAATTTPAVAAFESPSRLIQNA